MLRKKRAACLLVGVWFVIVLVGLGSVDAESALVVKKEQRTTIVSTDHGQVTAARISDGANASYLVHTFTLHPNSMFLPVILNANMLLYVHSGSGRLSYVEEDKIKCIDLVQGDVFRLLRGTLFFIHCYSKTAVVQQPLLINAIFPDSDYDLREPETGPYASIQELVLGFDRKALQATFKVSVEVVDQLLGGTKPPAIILVEPKPQAPKGNKLMNTIKKVNILRGDKDFQNPYGWVTTLAKKKVLKDSGISLFMVNLTAGSMMEPNWNTIAAEVVVVLKGRGMVRVVCSKLSQGRVCRNTRFEVEEGDVFLVPRFHAKAHMAFNDGAFVFMGFSIVSEEQQPQFLGGKESILRTLGSDMVAKTFNVPNTTLSQLVAPKDSSVIFACTSCAEDEFQIMMMEEKEKEQGGGGEDQRPGPGQGGGEEQRPGPGQGGGEEQRPGPGQGGGEEQRPGPGQGGGEEQWPGQGGGEEQRPGPGQGGGEEQWPGQGGGSGGEEQRPGEGGGEEQWPGQGGGSGGEEQRPGQGPGQGGGEEQRPGGGEEQRPEQGGGGSPWDSQGGGEGIEVE